MSSYDQRHAREFTFTVNQVLNGDFLFFGLDRTLGIGK